MRSDARMALVSQRASQRRRHIYHQDAGNSPAPAHYVLINNLVPHLSACKENESSCCDTALIHLKQIVQKKLFLLKQNCMASIMDAVIIFHGILELFCCLVG